MKVIRMCFEYLEKLPDRLYEYFQKASKIMIILINDVAIKVHDYNDVLQNKKFLINYFYKKK